MEYASLATVMLSFVGDTQQVCSRFVFFGKDYTIKIESCSIILNPTDDEET